MLVYWSLNEIRFTPDLTGIKPSKKLDFLVKQKFPQNHQYDFSKNVRQAFELFLVTVVLLLGLSVDVIFV